MRDPSLEAVDLKCLVDIDAFETWAGKLHFVPCDDAQDVLKVMLRLANGRTSPPNVLVALSKCEVDKVVEAVAANPATPSATLSFLVTHEARSVKCALVDNPELPADVYGILLNDPDSEVRYALAENHNIPRSIIWRLVDDENPFVQARAVQTLARIDSLKATVATRAVSQIYLAEDDTFVRTVLKLYLRQFPDYEIVGEAIDGTTAVADIHRLQPDIVLMDIGLPDMDGIEATIRAKSYAPNVKVMMVTSHQEEEDIIASFKAGADGYYLKTSSNKDLSKAIKAVLGGGHWIDPGIASAVLRQCIQNVRPAQSMIMDSMSASKPLTTQCPVDVLIELVRKLSDTNRVGMAVSVCNAAIYLAQRLYGESSQEARESLILLGDLYYLKENYRESETAYLVELMKEVGQVTSQDTSDIDRSVFFLAQLNEQLKNYEQAELYYSWSLRLRERINDQDAIEETRCRLKAVADKKINVSEPVQINEEAIHASLFK